MPEQHQRHRPRSHRATPPRQRLKERVRRRYRLRQWRRVIVGLSVLGGAGLIVAAAVWGGWYLVSNFHMAEWRLTAPAETAAVETLAEPRLVGVWQSDADANLQEMRRTRKVPDEEERELRKHVFTTKVTYTDKMVGTDTGGDVEVQTYQVVAKEGDEVVIRTWFASTRQEEEVRIRFAGPDTYWVEVEVEVPQVHLVECFRRVK